MDTAVSNNAPYLVVDSVFKTFQNERYKKKVLDGVSFTVNKGSFVTIFGPNGSGKTTLFNIISGLVESENNSIRLNAKPVKQSKISFLFQNFTDTLFPWKTCLENIAFPLEIDGIPADQRIKKVKSLVDLLDIQVPLNQFPYQCSGGQNQLVAIARALIKNPDLLLMDEPFSALDYERRLAMENKLLDIWSKSKVTTLCISHDIDEAIYLSDKVVVLSKIPTKVSGEVIVDLPRPRKQNIMESNQFHDLRKEVLRIFHDVTVK